ncbi:MAG: D-alanyl-D-alanine carboxypeptidase [Clostridia bacterium]|nr:D-alanyl-D-alanine carboxypeptidase [Clostridia bacterium]
MKKTLCLLICFFVLTINVSAAPQLDIKAKSVILTEASTGNVMYEQNSDERLPMASVTKVMTMLLTMEAIDSGRIAMDDMVTASERAKSMGGSTIFLDAGEQMSVHDLLKGIAVASGNDACVAMAEYIAGSESEFVRMMNERAKQLGMNNTNFVNTNGLDTEGHYSSARDIAIMSRELIKHEKIFEFTTIWTDSLRGGEFGLANTNKLIRFYNGANGLKTGSTDEALFCLSASAKRDGMQLIAVVLGSPTSQDRFDAARTLLDYGFANYKMMKVANTDEAIAFVPVEKGTEQSVVLKCESEFTMLTSKSGQEDIKIKTQIPESVPAPVKKGDKVGKIIFFSKGEQICEMALTAAEDVQRKNYLVIFVDIIKRWLTV